MAKKKRVFHCAECKSPCEIYKKGKGHRVLICPRCGILATNPLPLAAMALTALPSVIEGVGGMLGGKKKAEKGDVQKVVTDSLDKPNKGERYVKMALGG